jgi:uncharacterized protein (TIGR02147 family)
MKTDMPNIFEYIDFKKYLADFHKAKRAVDPGFTHAYICHKLGQPHSRSFFDNITTGRKKLSSTFVDLFIKLLGLGVAEAKFFRALVNYNQASGTEEKEFCFDQIVQLNQTPYKLLDKETYAYYKEWYHGTIRSLLGIIDFKNDYKELAKKLSPSIKASQARESIALLKKLGLIKADAQGHLKPADKVLSTGESVKDFILQQYQIQCLELGKQAIINSENQPCSTIAYTVYVSDKGYQRILDRLEQCKTEIRSIIHKDEESPTQVYQVNLQLFPKTKKSGKI